MNGGQEHASSDTEPHERVLHSGRLHPASLLWHLRGDLFQLAPLALVVVVEAFRERALPGRVFGVLPWSAFFAISLMVAFGMGIALVRYLRFQYWLTDHFLHVASGILSRKETRIPVQRIQDLNLDDSPLRRAFGIVRVQVHTSSTSQTEAVLDSLSRQSAEALGHALRSAQGRSAEPLEGLASEPAQSPQWTEKVGLSWLVLRGVTDNQGALLVLFFAVLLDAFVRAIELFEVDLRPHLLRLAWRWMVSDSAVGPQLFVVALISIIAIWLAGYAISVVLNVVRFWGFRLTLEHDDVLKRKYGLLTRRVYLLARNRVQAVSFVQGWTRRLLRLGELRVYDMGSGADTRRVSKTGADLLLPLVSRARAEQVAANVLGFESSERLAWQPISSRVVRRFMARGAAVGALAAAGLLWLEAFTWGRLLLTISAGAFLSGAYGYAVWRTFRWAASDQELRIRAGVLRRQSHRIPVARLQAATLRRTPFDRWAKLAELRVIVGGGTTFRIAHLPADAASSLEWSLARPQTRPQVSPHRHQPSNSPGQLAGPLPSGAQSKL